MKINIAPLDAGFVDRTLFFNLTRKTFSSEENIFRDRNVSLVFVLEDYCIAVDMENYFFYTYNRETNSLYGPYKDYEELVADVLFGKYDGLFYLLSRFKYSSGTGTYSFVFGDFVYDINTYNVLDFKGTAKELASIVKKIDTPPVYTFVPETSFSKGVINRFLISENAVFSKNNFPLKEEKNKYSKIIRIDRGDVVGVKKEQIGFFVFINTSKKTHATAFIPLKIAEGFVKYFTTLKDETLLKEIFNKDKTTVISNSNELLKVSQIFGINLNEDKKEVKVFECNLEKYLKVVINGETPDTLYYILKDGDKFYTLEFNIVSRTFLLKEFEPFSSNGIPISIVDGTIVVGEECPIENHADVTLNVGECILFDLEMGIADMYGVEFDVRFLINNKGLI